MDKITGHNLSSTWASSGWIGIRQKMPNSCLSVSSFITLLKQHIFYVCDATIFTVVKRSWRFVFTVCIPFYRFSWSVLCAFSSSIFRNGNFKRLSPVFRWKFMKMTKNICTGIYFRKLAWAPLSRSVIKDTTSFIVK